MKKIDFYFLIIVLLLFLPFFLNENLYAAYKTANAAHPFLIGFLKFAILATMGESIGLRMREGVYTKPGFGLMPKAVVWGLLGLTIVMAFQIFSAGSLVFLKSLGMNNASEALAGPMNWQRIAVAFTISITLNLIYAPILMTLHKITDTHIVRNSGTMSALLKPVMMGDIMSKLDWKVQWDFIFKKTIPFFWIPAHTITFLLPVEFRVLFAALLGIALGIILSIGVLMSKKA